MLPAAADAKLEGNGDGILDALQIRGEKIVRKLNSTLKENVQVPIHAVLRGLLPEEARKQMGRVKVTSLAPKQAVRDGQALAR